MVAASIGLSTAMENSGLAYRIGKALIDLFQPVGPVGLLFGVNIATTVLNAFVSNSASVSLVFPIAYSVTLFNNCVLIFLIVYSKQIAKNSTDISLRGIVYNVMMVRCSTKIEELIVIKLVLSLSLCLVCRLVAPILQHQSVIRRI